MYGQWIRVVVVLSVFFVGLTLSTAGFAFDVVIDSPVEDEHGNPPVVDPAATVTVVGSADVSVAVSFSIKAMRNDVMVSSFPVNLCAQDSQFSDAFPDNSWIPDVTYTVIAEGNGAETVQSGAFKAESGGGGGM